MTLLRECLADSPDYDPHHVELRCVLTGYETHEEYVRGYLLPYLSSAQRRYGRIPLKAEAQGWLQSHGFGDRETRLIPIEDKESLYNYVSSDWGRTWWLGLAIPNDKADPNLPPDMIKTRTKLERGPNNQGIQTPQDLEQARVNQLLLAQNLHPSFLKIFPQDLKKRSIANSSVSRYGVFLDWSAGYNARDGEEQNQPHLHLLQSPLDPEQVLVVGDLKFVPYLLSLMNSIEMLRRFDAQYYKDNPNVSDVNQEFMINASRGGKQAEIDFHTDVIPSKSNVAKDFHPLSWYVERLSDAHVIPQSLLNIHKDQDGLDQLKIAINEASFGNPPHPGELRKLSQILGRLEGYPEANAFVSVISSLMAAVDDGVYPLSGRTLTNTGRLNTLTAIERPSFQTTSNVNSFSTEKEILRAPTVQSLLP